MRAEVKIVNNMPSLNMEEVGALASSDAVLLAPEEVQRRIKGDVKTDEEKTRTDRLRERRRKKTAQAVGKGLKRKKEMPAGERREGKKAKREKVLSFLYGQRRGDGRTGYIWRTACRRVAISSTSCKKRCRLRFRPTRGSRRGKRRRRGMRV
jgi:hypothetical protein